MNKAYASCRAIATESKPSDNGVALLVSFWVLMSLITADHANANQMVFDMIRPQKRSCDTGLTLPADSLIKRVKTVDKTVFIDVRDNLDYQALHIPSSLNIPVHFIKTKLHLKPFHLVIVDKGSSLHRLLPVCRNLRARGFDVRILDGGMHAWSSCGGLLEGQRIAQVDYRYISPAAFFEEKDYDRRMLCDISADRSQISMHHMPNAIHLPLDAKPDIAHATMEALKTAHGHNTDMLLIAFNDTGKGYQRAHRAFHRAGFKTVFYLKGGVDAYEHYLKGLLRSWQPKNERVLTQNACGGCE